MSDSNSNKSEEQLAAELEQKFGASQQQPVTVDVNVRVQTGGGQPGQTQQPQQTQQPPAPAAPEGNISADDFVGKALLAGGGYSLTKIPGMLPSLQSPFASGDGSLSYDEAEKRAENFKNGQSQAAKSARYNPDGTLKSLGSDAKALKFTKVSAGLLTLGAAVYDGSNILAGMDRHDDQLTGEGLFGLATTAASVAIGSRFAGMKALIAGIGTAVGMNYGYNSNALGIKSMSTGIGGFLNGSPPAPATTTVAANNVASTNTMQVANITTGSQVTPAPTPTAPVAVITTNAPGV